LTLEDFDIALSTAYRDVSPSLFLLSKLPFY